MLFFPILLLLSIKTLLDAKQIWILLVFLACLLNFIVDETIKLRLARQFEALGLYHRLRNMVQYVDGHIRQISLVSVWERYLMEIIEW